MRRARIDCAPMDRSWRTPSVVLVCGCLILLIGFGIRAGFGLFMQPISLEYGWGREVLSFSLALQQLAWGALGAIAGGFADRYGPGRVIAVGALLYIAGLIGMVKGLTSPDPIQRDLMRTWSASPAQVFWKLRWPSSMPFLFASLKVAMAISLVGAIVGELPTGAQAGLGARLLAGSYYGQTLQIWAALLAAALIAAIMVAGIGKIDRMLARRMGATE